MTVKFSESGFDSGLSFEEACKMVKEAGLDTPQDSGYTEQEVTWLGSEYARSTQDAQWPEGVPYWYVTAFRDWLHQGPLPVGRRTLLVRRK